MTDNSILGFADSYAVFKAELESDHPEYLSRRGLANAILSIFDGLQSDQDPVMTLTDAIHVYRHWERKDGEAREAAEAQARAFECPSCGAPSGEACRRLSGGTAVALSHRRRYRAAGRSGRPAGATDREAPGCQP